MSHQSVVRARIAGMPAWFFYSLLTIFSWGAWGAVSKVASSALDAYTNQVFFSIGLLPLMVIAACFVRKSSGEGTRKGVAWAFLTGILGGLGNVAFFHALTGGKASIVVPVTALFPLVTVILAITFLHEKINRKQILGLALALSAIYLLSI